MPLVRRTIILISMIAILAIISGCGGGGGASTSDSGSTFADSGDGPLPGGGTALPAKTLNWDAPSTYTDGTPMNPTADLDRFEVYVNESGSFGDSEVPQAVLSAVDPATHQLATSFNLANIAALTRGPRYWVSLRAVALTGLKSDFSQPASFSF